MRFVLLFPILWIVLSAVHLVFGFHYRRWCLYCLAGKAFAHTKENSNMVNETEVLITDEPLSPLVQAEKERDTLFQLCRMALQQMEFQYGQRKRGWDVAFLMEQLRSATTTGDSVVDEVQQRMDAVVDAAVEWHVGHIDWTGDADTLGTAIDSLLELRGKPETCSCGEGEACSLPLCKGTPRQITEAINQCAGCGKTCAGSTCSEECAEEVCASGEAVKQFA